MAFHSFSFTKQLALLLSSVSLLSAAGWWGYSAYHLNTVLSNQIYLRAQVQSQQLSRLPSLIQAVEHNEPDTVSSIIATVQVGSDADFITVSDVNGIRLAHPVADRIGLPVMGGDLDRALTKGDAYLSHGVGSLGPSVRYISPIFSAKGDVVGMIKVGYLVNTLQVWGSERLLPLLLLGVLTVSICVALAWHFSRFVRRKMQHLEPWQLKLALETHQVVMQATHEGFIALDRDQKVYLVNDSAKTILNSPIVTSEKLERWVDDIGAFSLSGDDFINKIQRINGCDLIMNRVTLKNTNNESQGAIFSLRTQQEMQMLSEKISQVDKYLENIRITHHEYQNKLSTISGLLQMEEYEEAKTVCLAQAQASQSQLDCLKPLIHFPQLCALLVTKMCQTGDKGISLKVECETKLEQVNVMLTDEQLSTLIGNLLDNAIDAVADTQQASIHVSFREVAQEYILQVANNGPVIDVEIDALCSLGYTSKNDKEQHGIGLHLVRSIVESANGYIELDSDEIETGFTLYLPKEQGC